MTHVITAQDLLAWLRAKGWEVAIMDVSDAIHHVKAERLEMEGTGLCDAEWALWQRACTLPAGHADPYHVHPNGQKWRVPVTPTKDTLYAVIDKWLVTARVGGSVADVGTTSVNDLVSALLAALEPPIKPVEKING